MAGKKKVIKKRGIKKSSEKSGNEKDKKIDFEDYIYAHTLRNALDHEKAEIGRVLPKLFQHGLERRDIGKVMPKVKEIVEKVNSWDLKTRQLQYGKYDHLIPEKAEEREGLPELPGVDSEGKYKGKKVKLRVAPFPSGALHIGNAKTFLMNALYAEKYGGTITLVMDDTIGSKDKPIEEESYDLIKSGLKYLGIEYDKKIVYKSDRIKKYYKYAEKLIEKERAYVCHCKQEEFKKLKDLGKECGCRQFPPKIQMLRWKEMFKAKEGKSVLRIKTGMKHPNPAFRDRVLFKISDREHPRVGNKYRVWPTLEMSWAIDDHELGMTHVIRGNDLMIETDMENYIWEVFGWKGPEIIHTGLVNIEFNESGSKISKSKSGAEVKSGKYSGWDDPRTWSIQSLERRGIAVESIRQFVRSIGLNKQDITVPIDTLYAINRRMLDSDADRYYFVTNEKKISLDEIPKEFKEIEIPIHPEKDKIKKIKISKNLYVSSDDFDKLEGKEVRLIHLFNCKLKEESKITSVENKEIPKIQWVSDLEKVEARILMPDGKWIPGLAEADVSKLKVGDMIQFERFGFVRYDGTNKGVKEFWFAHK